MLEHFQGEEAFVERVLDARDRAGRGTPVLTRFLNPREREIVQSVIGAELKVESRGGFADAESQRVLIAPEWWETTEEDFQIDVFLVKYNTSFGTLGHRDVLGALMHLGMDRDVIGDIAQEPLAFAICHEHSDYVLMHLDTIRRSSITLELSSEPLEIHQAYETGEYILSSLRLDKVLSSCFRVSRAKAQDAIRHGDVKVNWRVTEDVSHVMKDGDMLSFRHHGRMKLALTDKTTRSGNYVALGHHYK